MTGAAMVSAASSVPRPTPPIATARKRRLDESDVSPPLSHKRTNVAAAEPPAITLAAVRPIVTVKKSTKAKRPQLKYDPDVPMSKEETSAWRREQRRKRNRESAAACRRRQRDRISELEVEVNVWRAKFDEALGQLKEMDESGALEIEKEIEKDIETSIKKEIEEYIAPQTGQPTEGCATPPSSPLNPVCVCTVSAADHRRPKLVSPQGQASPNNIVPPLVASSTNKVVRFFPTLTPKDLRAHGTNRIKQHSLKPKQRPSSHEEPGLKQELAEAGTEAIERTVRKHLREIIRPAVKIAGAFETQASPAPYVPAAPAQAPVVPSLDSIESVCDALLQVVPDSCLSLTERTTMPFPDACSSLLPSAVSTPAPVGLDCSASLMAPESSGHAATEVNKVTSVSTDESEEDSDLGDFLLDAVDWL